MAAFIAEADEKKPYIRRLHPEVRGMFEAMAPHMKFPTGFVFSHLGMFEWLLIKLIPKLNAADARQFTDLSDAVIRFAPIDIDKQQYASVHGENENISVDKLHLAVDFTRRCSGTIRRTPGKWPVFPAFIHCLTEKSAHRLCRRALFVTFPQRNRLKIGFFAVFQVAAAVVTRYDGKAASRQKRTREVPYA